MNTLTHSSSKVNLDQHLNYDLVIGVDSEYNSKVNMPTEPYTIQLSAGNGLEAVYIHPRCPESQMVCLIDAGLEVFDVNAVVTYMQSLGYKVRPSAKASKGVKTQKLKNSFKFELLLFFSFKDLQFLFETDEAYKKLLLPNLSKVRRIIGSKTFENVDSNGNLNVYRSESLRLPFEVQVSDEKGSSRWATLSVKLTDISAMQGIGGLASYADNVGVKMESKGEYTASQKSRMGEMILEDPLKFIEYAKGDSSALHAIRVNTMSYYNQVGELLGLPHYDDKDFPGYSTGKIVASMYHRWLCKQLGVDDSVLYKVNAYAGSAGITQLSKTYKNNNLTYLAMVDGGRAVKERRVSHLTGLLDDIDISGCYGEGQRNQVYPVGMPTITDKPQSLRTWLDTFGKQLVPGCWYARLSYKGAPFKQDLLISKEDGVTLRNGESVISQSWQWTVQGHDNEGMSYGDDGKDVYQKSMVLTTNSVYQAAVNHDLLQVLKRVSSRKEWDWLLDNAVIVSSLVYQKRHRINSIDEKMLDGYQLTEVGDSQGYLIDRKWVGVQMSEWVEPLLKERKKFAKGTPMNTFIKLLVNTTYGVIASAFFSTPKVCVSNVVAGNNITARARALAWGMAKGFHSVMTVTDGGVFDINSVAHFDPSRLSLDALESMYEGTTTNTDRKVFVNYQPLFGKHIDSYEDLVAHFQVTVDNFDSLVDAKLEKLTNAALKAGEKKMPVRAEALQIVTMGELDRVAWIHLKEQFGGKRTEPIDILDKDQFTFESKGLWSELTTHSKVDYELRNGDAVKVAFRGFSKVNTDEFLKASEGLEVDAAYQKAYEQAVKKGGKTYHPLNQALFQAVRDDKPARFTVEDQRMMTLGEYPNAKYPELLPHDTISDPKTYYSHTPHSGRFVDLNHAHTVRKAYESFKDSEQDHSEDIARLLP